MNATNDGKRETEDFTASEAAMKERLARGGFTPAQSAFLRTAGKVACGIFLIFGLPLALVEVSLGHAGMLWLGLPHLALASVILGGVLAGMFAFDSSGDDEAAITERPAAHTPMLHEPTKHTRKAA